MPDPQLGFPVGVSVARPWAFSFVIQPLRGQLLLPAWCLEERKAAGVAAGCKGSLMPPGGFVTFLGAGCLHAPQIPLACCPMLHDGLGVVGAHQAACLFLHSPWCLPRFIDVLGREILEDREVFSTTRGQSHQGGHLPFHMALGFAPTECMLRPGLSSCQRQQVSRCGNIGGRRHCLTATASCRH